MSTSRKTIIAIVGRPNVGKSTLFNRIIGARQAITSEVRGVTRDRHYADAEWAGKYFTLIDTGGFVPDSDDKFERAIREQAAIAVEQAQAIVFVVDARNGLHPTDEELGTILRKSNKPVLLVANKCDSDEIELQTGEFAKLGLGDAQSIGALGGRSIGDLLDSMIEFCTVEDETPNEHELKLAIVGKPNVGKSSFANSLLGQERCIVTDIAGTTRDAIDTSMTYLDKEVLLIDTAGLRKRKYVDESVEFYSTLRTLRAIERSNVTAVLIDATTGLEGQDSTIIREVSEQKKGLLIVVNKWDLVEKDTMTSAKFEKKIREALPTLDYIPFVFISAKTKQRVTKVLDIAFTIKEELAKRISTSKLNEELGAIIEATPPAAYHGKDLRIKFITQVRTSPPVFAFFTNDPKLIQENYKRFLENTIREKFGFIGVPLTLVFKSSSKKNPEG